MKHCPPLTTVLSIDKQHGVSALSDTPFSYYQYFNIFVYCSDTYVKYGLPVIGWVCISA